MAPTTDMERRTIEPDAPVFAPLERGHVAALRWLRRLFWLALALLVVVVLIPRATTWFLARGDVAHRPADIPRLEQGERRAAIVFGAGLLDRRPSPLLSDRIEASVELLDEHRVDMLLMTGDNSTKYHDEPSAMRRRAIELGAPVRRVAVDFAGRRTRDSCVRAREVFGIREAVVVTNAFHVDRALAHCRAAGIDATGYSVDDSRHGRIARAQWRIRELAATGRGLVEAWVIKPAPEVGGEPIDTYDPCQLYESFAPSVREDTADEFRQFGC